MTLKKENQFQYWSINEPIDVEKKILISHVKAHSASINTIQFTSDGTNLITGGSDDTVRVWDMDGNEVLFISGHSAPVVDIELHQNENFIFSASEDSTVRIWDRTNGKELAVISDAKRSVKDVQISYNNQLITGSKDGFLRVYDLSNIEKPNIIHEIKVSTITCLAVHPSSPICAVGLTSNAIAIVDFEVGTVLDQYFSHSLPIQGLDFSRNGNFLVSASIDQFCRVWKVDKLGGGVIQELTGFQAHSSAIHTIKFCPINDAFCTGSYDRSVGVWTPGKIKPIRKFRGPKLAINDVAWNPDGQTIAVASSDGSFRVFSMKSDSKDPIMAITKTKKVISTIKMSNDFSNILTGYLDGSIRFLDLKGKEIQSIPNAHNALVTFVGLTPTGQLLSASEDKYLKLWDPESMDLLHKGEGHSSGVRGVAIHKDSEWCISSSIDATVRQWQLPSLAELTTIKSHKYSVNDLALSPLGTSFASASNDRSILCYDSESKSIKQTLTGHPDSVTSISYLLKDNFLISGGKKGDIIVYDTLKGQQIKKINLHSDEILEINISQCNKFLGILSADNSVSIFAIDSMKDESFNLNQVFLVNVGSNPTDFCWVPTSELKRVFLVATEIGELIEFTLIPKKS
ncbi:MAG: WD40 domain-containing protein [Candidatus Hodarchaeales archaeon]